MKKSAKIISGMFFCQKSQRLWYHTLSLYIGQSFKSLVFSCSVGSLAREAGLFQRTFQRLSGVIGFHPTCICLFFAWSYRIVRMGPKNKYGIIHTLIGSFFYFTVCNVMCTVSNFLFIIILNKHKVVTRYVFYISVCMICAYVESDIVAVFYFILNSQGSLNNLKLTALRTAALGLTLTLSFSSSMHIIRKLMKPQESVFEGLSEKWVTVFQWD